MTLLFAIAVGCAPPPAPPAPPGVPDELPPVLPAFEGPVPRNVLLLSIDTFRRDRVGSYAPETMPFLAQLMAEGFVLDNHATCGNWTLLGMACSVNGRLNEENGYIPELGGTEPLPDGPTLASTLADRYRVLVSGNGWFSADWNADQGFDESAIRRNGAVGILGDALTRLEAAEQGGEVEHGWLVHTHVMEPHAPYNPPAVYLEAEAALEPVPWDLSMDSEHYAAGDAWPALSPGEQALLKAHFDLRYQGELAWLDEELRVIWADLDLQGRLDDTLVVIFNDHGEQLFDHGNESHAYGLHAGENDGFALFWSKAIVAGTWSGPTSQIDLAPTLLSLLGAEIPSAMTGVPVGQASDDRPVFALTSARLGTQQSVRQSGWKLIYSWRSGALELFELSADPGERANLYQPLHPVGRHLWDLLLPHVVQAEPIVLDDVPTWPAGLPRR